LWNLACPEAVVEDRNPEFGEGAGGPASGFESAVAESSSHPRQFVEDGAGEELAGGLGERPRRGRGGGLVRVVVVVVGVGFGEVVGVVFEGGHGRTRGRGRSARV
jgi:hypothetical protein